MSEQNILTIAGIAIAIVLIILLSAMSRASARRRKRDAAHKGVRRNISERR
jgi:hypothetical protein